MKRINYNILLFIGLGIVFSACSSSSSMQITIDSKTRADAGGSGVMLQAFAWTSSKTGKNWYKTIKNNSADIKDVFQYVWYPPVSDSGDGYGYHPRELKNYESNFGTKAELLDSISTISSDYTKPIADIVINHRVGTYNWGSFTNPSFGEDYYAICKDDEGFSNSSSDMYKSTKRGAADTGASWGGARDIDHTNTTVRSRISEWMNELRDMGFAGWRYDFVRGYAGKYTGYYNSMTNPEFSVGEYWASNFMIPYWISETKDGVVDGVKGTASRAFDFELKDNLNSVFGKTAGTANSNYNKFASSSNLFRSYPGYAVTFVENHDTASTQQQYPMDTDDIAAAYALTLTHPGYPCVAWFHYFTAAESKDSSSAQYIGGNTVPGLSISYKDYIKTLVAMRKTLGINDLSECKVLSATSSQYAAEITGTNGAFVVGLGKEYGTPSGYKDFIKGTGFEIYYREF